MALPGVRSAAAVLALALAWGAPASAQGTTRGDPKEALEDIPLGLDPLPRFDDAASAQRHCPHGAVVWPDPDTGYFHGPHSSRFAAAQGGFACLEDALGAGYWDTNPFSDSHGHGGRSFPIDPALRPDIGT